MSAQHCPPSLCRPQRRFCAGRYHLPLGLSDNGHDPHDQLVGFWHIGSRELHAGFLKAQQEVSITGQAVQLRYEDTCSYMWLLSQAQAPEVGAQP